MEKKEYDFLAGIVLMILGVAIVGESIRMWQDVEGDFNQSPGLMPGMLGGCLIVAALVLTMQSWREAGRGAVFGKLAAGFSSLFGANRKFTKDYAIVMAAVAFFTFVLLPNLPFWLSSFIFMVYTMLLAGAKKLWIVLVASAGVSGAIQLVFEKIFRVPLPTSPEADTFFRGIFSSISNIF